MTPKQAVEWFDQHVAQCEHIRARKPCQHEVTIECAVCHRPYLESGVFISQRYGTTCDTCVKTL